MRAIMYHYIREFDPSLPNFKFLDINDFKKQLDWFENTFGFVSRDEFEQSMLKKTPFNNPGQIILTFDDGFLDHYQYVYPELIKRGLWGIFYLSTGPYASNKILDVHRIQLLCGQVRGTDLLKETLSLVSEDMIEAWKVREFKNSRYTNQINVAGVKDVKLILNYYIKPEHKEIIIDQLCSIFNIAYPADNYYLNINQIKHMAQNNMIFGSHTVNHNVMSTLTLTQQTAEIQDSFLFLEQNLSQAYKTYCHPYGGSASYNQNTIDILTKNNVHFSFSVESRQITPSDLRNSSQSLPRFDCNEFPHGLAK